MQVYPKVQVPCGMADNVGEKEVEEDRSQNAPLLDANVDVQWL